MRIVCSPDQSVLASESSDEYLGVLLYGRAQNGESGSIGAALQERVTHAAKLSPVPRAWDFLSIALSVVAADIAGHRDKSPDGWTREIDLQIAVGDEPFWSSQRALLESALAFLTTDRWTIQFTGGGFQADAPAKAVVPAEDCVTLLSGGLDSLVGAIDLAACGRRPYAVSQIVKGNASHQEEFARRIGAGLGHLALNHNADVPDGESPPSQRARSIVFLAYGVLAATALRRYHEGVSVDLFLCENAFISANPPLTPARVGSLSTRTTHPVFIRQVQRLLESAGLNVQLRNPYQSTTKGEMLAGCSDQGLLLELAGRSTSCGRFGHFGYRHCGRCVPCQIRRAAFIRWDVHDPTAYIYENLGSDDQDHARFDDVRAAALAIAEVESDGFDAWFGTTLSTALLEDSTQVRAAVRRGLQELAVLHQRYGVK